MYSRIIPLILAAVGVLCAQGPRGPQPGNPARPGPGLDMSKAQTIEGVVSAVNVAYGTRYPSVQIGDATVKVAPVWFLLENDFEIQATAAPSLSAKDPYLSAITLANTTSGASLALRDANGVTLCTQAGPSHGVIVPGGAGGSRNGGPAAICAGCGGPTSISTASGVVDQVSSGVGIQMPSLVLKTSDGKILTIKIGPERILQAADFEVAAGDNLTVRYAVMCTGDTVALELTNSAGVKLVLRNDDGTPAWR